MHGLKSDTIVGYTYAADTYCPPCTLERVSGPDRDPWVSIDTQLYQVARHRGIDYVDERTYDTDDFPKVIFATDAGNEVCAGCHEPLVGA